MEQLLEKIKENLFFFGGRCATPEAGNEAGLNYSTLKSYIILIRKQLDIIMRCQTLEEELEALARIFVMIVELDIMECFVTNNNPILDPFEHSVVATIYEVPECILLDNRIDAEYKKKLLNLSVYTQPYYERLKHLSQKYTAKQIIEGVLKSERSMLFTSHDGAQHFMCQHFFQTKLKKQYTNLEGDRILPFSILTDGTVQFGNIEPKGTVKLIHMHDKSDENVFSDKRAVYQIRECKKGESKFYALFEIIGNTATLIPGPLTKKVF